MSSTTLDLPSKTFRTDETTSSQDVPSPKTSPTTPIRRRTQPFSIQTRNAHTPTHLPSQRDFPERSSNKNGNGLASPSITPPSANTKHSQTRHHPSSPSPYQRSSLHHHQREPHTARGRDTWGLPPISPCASITHASTASTVDYLLQSAASPCSHHPSSSDSSPSPPPLAPPSRRLPSPTQPSTSPSAQTLSPAEQTALSGLFHLRASALSTETNPHPHRPFSSTNALSSLPASHARKLSCALALLALRRHCLREEELTYRRLLVESGLLVVSDEGVDSDGETVVDEEGGRRGYGMGSGEESNPIGLSETRLAAGLKTGGREGLGLRRGGGFKAGKTVGGKGAGVDAQRRVDARGRKVIRASRMGTGVGKEGRVVEVEVKRRRWTVQALGYRRERGRKRAGTAGGGGGEYV